MARGRRHGGQAGANNIWPGFVDALATLLLGIIFLLVVFVIAQVILSHSITDKDEALEKLNQQVNELAELLDLERRANADLRLNIAQLSSSLQAAVAERDNLSTRLENLESENRVSQETLANLENQTASQQEAVRQHLLEIASLREDILALRTLRDELENRITELANQLETSKVALEDSEAARRDAAREILSLRDRSKQLKAELADEAERTRLAQAEVKKRDIQLDELTAAFNLLKIKLDESVQLTTEQEGQVALLNQQLAALRLQVQILNKALEASEKRDLEQQAVIKDLGSRLNKALASKVAELARYRSEFFGRLREVLGGRKDIRIVGDRFVFQSEVLFVSGSASLEPAGAESLARLANTLLEISGDIPADLDWVLRIDGHTDQDPINTPEFPSNWELSTARAISVVKFLIAQGIEPKRLAATGFGEFQPLDPADSDAAKNRNRRIEFKLTQH